MTREALRANNDKRIIGRWKILETTTDKGKEKRDYVCNKLLATGAVDDKKNKGTKLLITKGRNHVCLGS